MSTIALLAVVTVLWGAAARSGLHLDEAAAQDTVLQVVFVALGVGALILVPSMTWLYVLFQRQPSAQISEWRSPGTVRAHVRTAAPTVLLLVRRDRWTYVRQVHSSRDERGDRQDAE